MQLMSEIDAGQEAAKKSGRKSAKKAAKKSAKKAVKKASKKAAKRAKSPARVKKAAPRKRAKKAAKKRARKARKPIPTPPPISQTLEEVKRQFMEKCPRCSSPMKNTFINLGPNQRLQVNQCKVCKFYLPA